MRRVVCMTSSAGLKPGYQFERLAFVKLLGLQRFRQVAGQDQFASGIQGCAGRLNLGSNFLAVCFLLHQALDPSNLPFDPPEAVEHLFSQIITNMHMIIVPYTLPRIACTATAITVE